MLRQYRQAEQDEHVYGFWVCECNVRRKLVVRPATVDKLEKEEKVNAACNTKNNLISMAYP